MTEMLLGSANAAARAISSGEVSSRELTELLLARIATVNPKLNAVVELCADRALREAAQADAATARGAPLGPLHGVPMTIKESFSVAGMHTTWGEPAFHDVVADQDAMVVARLRRAGAVVVGTTNVASMLADYGQTTNEVYGTTNNPWDVTRTPGGSSGGAAAAVAAGLAFLEYASDLVGSIRIPAAACGVYGLKPSTGIVPMTGFHPPGPPPLPSERTGPLGVGPLGRTPGDLRTALSVTAGPEDPAATAYSWHLPPPRHTRLGDFRVGVMLHDDHVQVSSEVGAVLSDAVDALARAGVKIVEGWPQGLDPWQVHESFGLHVGSFFTFQRPTAADDALAGLVEHEHRRMAARAAWNRYFTDADVFLCPVTITPAFPHDDTAFEQRTISTPDGPRAYAEQTYWISHASLPGLPALAAPAGLSRSGLPVGLQVLGPLYEDDTVLAFAETLAGVIGGYRPPPAMYRHHDATGSVS